MYLWSYVVAQDFAEHWEGGVLDSHEESSERGVEDMDQMEVIDASFLVIFEDQKETEQSPYFGAPPEANDTSPPMHLPSTMNPVIENTLNYWVFEGTVGS